MASRTQVDSNSHPAEVAMEDDHTIDSRDKRLCLEEMLLGMQHLHSTIPLRHFWGAAAVAAGSGLWLLLLPNPFHSPLRRRSSRPVGLAAYIPTRRRYLRHRPRPKTLMCLCAVVADTDIAAAAAAVISVALECVVAGTRVTDVDRDKDSNADQAAVLVIVVENSMTLVVAADVVPAAVWRLVVFVAFCIWIDLCWSTTNSHRQSHRLLQPSHRHCSRTRLRYVSCLR